MRPGLGGSSVSARRRMRPDLGGFSVSRLFAGVVPGTDAPLSDPAGSVMGVRTLWRRLGLRPGLLPEAVTVTPACGLAGASPGYARSAYAHCVRAARSLADNPE